jgi:hypothetical protein
MDKPIVFATEVPNNSIHAVYPSAPLPSHMNRHTTVYVETRDSNDSCDDLCSILLCCCLIQSLSDQM